MIVPKMSELLSHCSLTLSLKTCWIKNRANVVRSTLGDEFSKEKRRKENFQELKLLLRET